MTHYVLLALTAWFSWTTFVLFQASYLFSFGIKQYDQIGPDSLTKFSEMRMDNITKFARQYLVGSTRRWALHVAGLAMFAYFTFLVLSGTTTELFTELIVLLSVFVVVTLQYARVKYPVAVWALSLRQLYLSQSMDEVLNLLYSVAHRVEQLTEQLANGEGDPEELKQYEELARTCVTTGIRIKAEMDQIGRKLQS